MTATTIRDLLNRVDIEDPHEFATSYVNHVEDSKKKRQAPMSLATAVYRWSRLRSI